MEPSRFNGWLIAAGAGLVGGLGLDSFADQEPQWAFVALLSTALGWLINKGHLPVTITVRLADFERVAFTHRSEDGSDPGQRESSGE